MSLEKTFTGGNLVDINVSMWTGQKRLQAEDLGMIATDINDAFSLGRKMLIPAEILAEFKRLDSLLRNTLVKHSFSFAFGGARFVPKLKFMDFATDADKIIYQFNRLADDLAANYGQYRQDMRKSYVEAAHEAYARAQSLTKGFSKDETEFINEFIERIEKAYPDAKEIRGRFSMEYTVFQVALPDLTRAKYDDLVEEDAKIRMMQEAHQKALYKKIHDFVDTSVNELRGKATKVLQRMSDLIASDRAFNESSLTTMRNMVDDYEKLDFVGDEQFIKHLKYFRMKCIDGYTAKTILNDKVVRETILRELKKILVVAVDRSAIDALANKYRQGIGN